MKKTLTSDDFVEELFRNAPDALSRKKVCETTGDAHSVKSLANLDSEGKGIHPRFRIAGKVFYPKQAAIVFYKQHFRSF